MMLSLMVFTHLKASSSCCTLNACTSCRRAVPLGVFQLHQAMLPYVWRHCFGVAGADRLQVAAHCLGLASGFVNVRANGYGDSNVSLDSSTSGLHTVFILAGNDMPGWL
jgi:hypothetical protein